MKKKRIANEDPSINFRVSKTLKDSIEAEALKRNMTTSKYLREVLTRVHEGTYCEEELEKRKRESFLFSKEFMQLVIWMYRSRSDKKVKENKEQMEHYIAVLKRAGEYFDKALNDEFDKVLANLIQFSKKEPRDYSTYGFIDSYDKNEKFNFGVLEQVFLDNERLESILMRQKL